MTAITPFDRRFLLSLMLLVEYKSSNFTFEIELELFNG